MESMIRLLPYAVADGPRNMAADETLVRSAAAGIASLRFYGWTQATVSLGYFQPAAVRVADPHLANLPWVRRPSGGATLVHHHELTYAISLPCGSPWQTGESWMPRMHRIITSALWRSLSIEVVAATAVAKASDVLCFQQHTPGDLLSGGHKIVGSAQRKYRQALMQHGSVMLAQSEYAPALPGIRETTGIHLDAQPLADAIGAAFANETAWRVEARDWTACEKSRIEELALSRYATGAWNERR